MVLEANFEKVNVVRPASTGFETPSATSSVSLEDCLEQVVQWVASLRGKEYFIEPLEAFMAKWGKSFPEDPFYQDRMNYFLEHCILEQPMTENADGLTPFKSYMKESSGARLLSHKSWQSFCDYRHSLYEILKSAASQIIIRDLLTGRQYKVVPKESETLKFMAKKTIFQGFIFSLSHDEYRLGQGLIIHPDRARKQILKFMKAQKKVPRFSEHEIVRMMAMTNMRFLRMQHVDPANIYAQISG